MEAKRILFIINPIAGKGHGESIIPKIKAIIAAKRINSEVIITEKKGHASQLASEHSGKFDVITAVGGDGTISEVVNGFKTIDNNILGIIPCGSGNDFARTIHINESIESDINTIVHLNKIKALDLGEARITTQDNQVLNVRFLNSFGLGFDALVTKIIQKSTYLRGLPLYLSAVFKALFIYNSSEITAKFDNDYISGKKLVIAIGNGPTAGGGFKLNPTADPMDGLLDACIINELSKPRILVELPKAIFGIHTKLPFVKMVKFSSAEIECEQPVHVHADGDLVGDNIIRIKLGVSASKINVVTNI